VQLLKLAPAHRLCDVAATAGCAQVRDHAILDRLPVREEGVVEVKQNYGDHTPIVTGARS